MEDESSDESENARLRRRIRTLEEELAAAQARVVSLESEVSSLRAICRFQPVPESSSIQFDSIWSSVGPLMSPTVPTGSGSDDESSLVPSREAPPSNQEPSARHLDFSVITEASVLRGHASEIFGCIWHPRNPNVLSSCSGDGTARIWTIPSELSGSESGDAASDGAKVLQNAREHPPEGASSSTDTTSMDWHPSGSLLATGSYDGISRVWAESGELRSVLEGHRGPIFSVKWNPVASEILLTGGVDGSAIAWDVNSSQILQKFGHHRAPVLEIDWMDQDVFASCSTDKTIAVCRMGNDAPMVRLAGHTDEVNCVGWRPTTSAATSGTHQRLLASCSDDRTVKVWSLDSETPVCDFRSHRKEVYDIAWSPAKPYLASAAFDNMAMIWDVVRGELLHSLALHSAPIYTISFSPNGKYLASGSFDSSVHVWDVKTGTLFRTYSGTGSVFEVGWNVTGERVCACFSDSITTEFSVHVFDIIM